MKKVKIAIASLIFMAVMILNVIVNVNLQGNPEYDVSTLVKQAMAVDIEEVTITCSTGGSGVCYERHWLYYWDCVATGNPMDVCW